MFQNPEAGTPTPTNSAARSPRSEDVRYLLYGTLLEIVREAIPLGESHNQNPAPKALCRNQRMEQTHAYGTS